MNIEKLGKFLDVLQSNDTVTVSLEHDGDLSDLCNIKYRTREIYEIIRPFFDEVIAKQSVTSESCKYCDKPMYLKWSISFIDGYYKLNDDCNYCPNCGRKIN